MEMQQVRYFIALSKTLNFTRAAEQANVSQPALTRAIQQLEHELGGPLFHRERQRTHLSELGRIMLPYLTTIYEQSEAAREHARSIKKLERATLHIGAMCTIGPSLVADLLWKFQQMHPDVDVVVTDRGAGPLLESLAAGEIHVALFGMPDEPDLRFHAVPLFQERFVVAIPPTHEFAEKNVVHVADLNEKNYVSRSNCEVYEFAKRKFNNAGAYVKQVFTSERDDWVQGMIRAGLGFGFFPEFCVNDPGLVTRRLIDPEIVRTIMLVTVRGRPHSPAVGAFVREARVYDWPQTQFDGPPPDVAFGRTAFEDRPQMGA
jgi:DNA-binding transcriptional LysR family regulator